MASRKNKWRKCGKLEFRRETARYSDGTLMYEDRLFVRVRGIACVVVAPFESKYQPEKTLSVLCGTYRLGRPGQVAHWARDYLDARIGGDLPQ